ncbi:MAG TPA: cytochrome c3 family protein [Anaeromyxobacteraceae bacterium]|nr:cytochrome c3 family protein [Anaeromyxobacteraceae bacterium]
MSFRLLLAAAVAALPGLGMPLARHGPLPFGAKAVSTHAPYEAGDCTACHARGDPFEPGPLHEEGDRLCFGCHVEVTKHAHAFRKCAKCHNAHDAMLPHLLVVQADACPSCHQDKQR